MNAGNSDETNDPTEQIPSKNPVQGPGANVLLKRALQSKLIDRKTFRQIEAMLREDSTFDVRGYLEGNVGLDPKVLDDLEQFEKELIDSHNGDTARIEASITEAIQSAEEFEKTFAAHQPPDDLLTPPGPFDAQAETVEDTHGKKRAGDITEDDDHPGSNKANSSFGFFESARYRILQLISRGGQADVFRAWDIELKSFVAIKTVRMEKFLELSPRDQILTCKRFVQEALITRRLTHPSVIPIYALDHSPVRNQELGLDHLPNGIPFLILPFYPNGDLSKEIEKLRIRDESMQIDASESDLLFRERIDSLIEVCRAVSQGHERGIIHRDIKPKNILIGHQGEVYLADWGIAKSLRKYSGATKTHESTDGTVRSGSEQTEWGYYGTAAYMSPEQANCDVHLHNDSTDIFLLGATLYALAYGEAPYASKDPHESRRRAASCDVDWSRPVLPGVDDGLIGICKKAMSPEQSDRFESVKNLGDELKRWRADLPLSHVKESPRRKASRFLKRHSRSLAAATIVSLLGTGGLIVANYRISEARDVAVTAKKETETALDQKSAALVKAEKAAIAEARAKEEEVAARQLAEKNFAFVSSLARDMLKVVAQKLPAIPGMSKVRLEIAEDLANRLKGFATRPENQNNDGIRLLWAQVEREAGNVARFIGDPKRAKTHYRNALSLLIELARKGIALVDLAQVYYDNAILDQMTGNYAAAEKSLDQAIQIVTHVRGDQKIPKLDEFFEFVLQIAKSALLAQVGRDDDQKKVLERIETLQRTWFAKLKEVDDQQFKYAVSARFEFANHHLRANDHDLALKFFREALDESEQKRNQVAAAKQELQPDYHYLIGDSHHGLADALHAKGDPASIQEAFGHYEVAYKTFFALDKEAQGAASYLDNLLWAFVDMKRFERETQMKFEGLMDDASALEKADKLVAESSDPEKKALRAHILAEMAHQERNPQKRTELAKRAAADLEAVNEKLPLRKDRQNDLKKLRESFDLK